MMRILVANKFWYVRGGLERVMFDEIALLEDAGHEVAHFSAAHPDNVASPWSDDFVPYLEIGAGSALSAIEKAQAVARMFDNRVAARCFGRVIERFEPDVVHCHGIHRQLSPSLLRVARAAGVPVVQTLHDYHHLCPADVLLRGGYVACDPPVCSAYWYGPAVSNRCVRGSLAASALSAAETFESRVLGRYERGVARFICPSEFLATKMRDGGWNVPMTVVRNAVAAPPRSSAASREGFLFAGRLSPEKGVDVFLKAAEIAGVAAIVAGDGPLRPALEAAHPTATFLGHLESSRVFELLGGVRAAVVPSTALENSPLSVLEPMAAGVPVIASRVGGIPELYDDGVEGLLVPPGDVDALSSALRRVATDDAFAVSAGRLAYRRVVDNHTPERHLRELVGVYTSVLHEKGSR